MGGLASSDAGALFLLAQEGTQPAADEAVEDAEQSWRGMFEVAKPPPKHRVEIGDDPFQAIASAAGRHPPHFVFERLQALLAHQPAACLEPVAKEVEPLSRLAAVAEARLVRMEAQTADPNPRLNLMQGGHGPAFPPTQDHDIGGVPPRPSTAHS